MKRKLALMLKGLFEDSIDYSKAEMFEEIEKDDMRQLDILMNDFVGVKYYSIDNSEVLKVNLEKEANGINCDVFILLSDKNKFYLEKNIEPRRAFLRFYNESIYFKVSMERIQGYQEAFNDRLTVASIDQLLQY